MSLDLAKLVNLANTARAKAQQRQRAERGRSWYRISNATAQRAEVYLYDAIGEWGVSADDFVNELRGITAKAIDLHLNCEGGEVFDGLAMYAALAAHPAHITAHVDSLAASAASFVMQAADHRIVAKNSRIMIHDAHGLVVGNARDMREMANLLDDLSDNVASIYADRAGGTIAKWRAAMHGPDGADGTWYAAQAAVDAGLADEVAGAQPKNVATTQPVAAIETTPDVQVEPFDVEAFQRAMREGLR